MIANLMLAVMDVIAGALLLITMLTGAQTVLRDVKERHPGMWLSIWCYVVVVYLECRTVHSLFIELATVIRP